MPSFAGSIQVFKNYIGFNLSWQQVFYAFPLCCKGPDICCRNGDRSDVQQGDRVIALKRDGMRWQGPRIETPENILVYGKAGGGGKVCDPAPVRNSALLSFAIPFSSAKWATALLRNNFV